MLIYLQVPKFELFMVDSKKAAISSREASGSPGCPYQELFYPF